MTDPIKYLYIINYWEPKREGLLNVIAESDKECFTLLSEEPAFPKEWESLIWPAIQNAQKLTLTTNYKSDLIEAFIP